MSAAPLHLVLDSRLDELDRLAEGIEAFCAAASLPGEAPVFALCADELFTNVVLHAFGGKAGHPVAVTLRRVGGGMEIEMVDGGPPFDPTVPTRPDLAAPVEEREIGGLGRHLVSTLMERFCYRRIGSRNQVVFGRGAGDREERRVAVTIQEERVCSVAVLAVDGRLDGASAPQLDERIAPAIAAATALVLDLAGLDYASSAGLRVLLKAAKQAKAARKPLALAAITPAVKEVFDISGFTAIFAIHPDRAAAVAAVG